MPGTVPDRSPAGTVPGVPSLDVHVPTLDGVAGASLHLPEGSGPWPGVLMYPDAASLRDVFRDMGQRLADQGFVVLVPDLYYRAGEYEPLSISTLFADPDQRARLGALAGVLTVDKVSEDAGAFVDYLVARPEVVSGPVGTTGYCMGGRMSLVAAGALGDRVGAAASFHGGRLAVEDDPNSPHLLADGVRAVVYVAGAQDDGSFDDAQAARLHEAYDAAGVEHTIETYPARHGWAVPDNPTFDEAAAERHWAAMVELFRTRLG